MPEVGLETKDERGARPGKAAGTALGCFRESGRRARHQRQGWDEPTIGRRGLGDTTGLITRGNGGADVHDLAAAAWPAAERGLTDSRGGRISVAEGAERPGLDHSVVAVISRSRDHGEECDGQRDDPDATGA